MLGKHKHPFEVLEKYEHARHRKLIIKKGTKAQVEAFIRNLKLKEANEFKQKPVLILGSILIAFLLIAGGIKLLQLVFLQPN